MIFAINHLLGTKLWLISTLILRWNFLYRQKYFEIIQKISAANFEKAYMPHNLINSIISVEDKRFFRHCGVDFYSILRAIKNNLFTKKTEGASTITQQLIRVLTNEKDIKISRKIREILFAISIEKKFSKREILLAYFKYYKFNKCDGIFNFCSIQSIKIETISASDSAQVAARLKYPIVTQKNYVKYLKRVRTIEIKTSKASYKYNEFHFFHKKDIAK